MIIETKFDVDQEVWYMHDDKVQKGRIITIDIFKSSLAQFEVYDVTCKSDLGIFRSVKKSPNDLFASKEKFIESIS